MRTFYIYYIYCDLITIPYGKKGTGDSITISPEHKEVREFQPLEPPLLAVEKMVFFEGSRTSPQKLLGGKLIFQPYAFPSGWFHF